MVAIVSKTELCKRTRYVHPRSSKAVFYQIYVNQVVQNSLIVIETSRFMGKDKYFKPKLEFSQLFFTFYFYV